VSLGFPRITGVDGCIHDGWLYLREFRGVSRDYIYYFFLHITEALRTFASGTTQPNLNTDIAKRLRVPVPPPEEQDLIVSALSTLDDQIEIGRRMNRTLDTLASALFGSWFVDFDPVVAKRDGRRPVGVPAEAMDLFPSHFEKSDRGPIPQGWHATSVGEHFDVTMGQSPPGSTYNENGDGLPFYQGRTDFGFRFPIRRVFCTAPTRLAEKGDTLVSVRAPVGDANVASERCAIGRGVAAVRHKGGYASFTYYAMRSLRDEFDVYEGEGTLFGAIGGHDFRRLPLVHPDSPVLAAFEALVRPMDALIASNERESRTLTDLRNTLLGPLLSGALTIKAAQKAVEAVV
jgi:type I restriction enzyme S subunit